METNYCNFTNDTMYCDGICSNCGNSKAELTNEFIAPDFVGFYDSIFTPYFEEAIPISQPVFVSQKREG